MLLRETFEMRKEILLEETPGSRRVKREKVMDAASCGDIKGWSLQTGGEGFVFPLRRYHHEGGPGAVCEVLAFVVERLLACACNEPLQYSVKVCLFFRTDSIAAHFAMRDAL